MIINPIDLWCFLDKNCPQEIPLDPDKQDDLIKNLENKVVTWLEDHNATQSDDAFLYVSQFVAKAWTFLEPVGHGDGDEKKAKRMCLLYIVMNLLYLRDRTRDMR